MYKSGIILFSATVLCVSCGAPSQLKGGWSAQSMECPLKDKTKRFTDTFDDNKKKHVLHFKENNQVQLIYPEFDVAEQEEGEKKEEKTCDLVITGKYSTSFFGGQLYFDFKDDETGAFQVTKGENCDLSQDSQLPQKMPEGSPYSQDPSVSIAKVNPEELHLAFKGHKKCKNEQLFFIFTRL